jgi:serine/threonine-protein kinase
MDEKARLTEHLPELIGRYRPQERIGQGAMGEVYKAFDPAIKRTLAIKTIRLDIPRGSPQYRTFIERFYHEARISGTLSHPNIVTLFDIGEEAGLPYLAMEFVEGETIAALLERGTRFKPEMVIALASQIASALDYAHSKGIIHRDVKPSNMILFEGERIKITDFGIAKAMDAEMTQSGTLLGTPSYMSPEQAMGDKLDGRSDIFSLGVCCFEMLSGEQPFPGNNVTSILYKLVHVDPIEPANLEMNGLVPQKWHEVFGKVLAKKPADRYQTAGAFVHDLEFCLGSWFSALGDEDTVPMDVPAAAEPTRPMARPAPPAVTTPGSGPGEEATVVLPVIAVATGADAGAEEAATVVLGTPAFASTPAPAPLRPAATDDSATVVLKPAPSRVAAGRAGRAAAASPDAATAVFEDPATKALAAPDLEPTIVLANELTVPAPRAPAVASQTMPGLAKVPVSKPPAEASATIPAVSRRVPRRIPSDAIVAGAAALFVLALIVAGFVVFRPRAASVPAAAPTPGAEATPAAVPTAAVASLPAPQPGTLNVETIPAGAGVWVNNEPQGSTPLELAGLPPGSYDVRLEMKGYESQTRTVSITPEAPRAEVSLALARAAAATGTADFLSTPFGATVLVGGSQVGVTPMTEYKLRAGSHRVELVKDGYESWTGTLVVAAGQRGRLDAQLKPKAVATPPPPETPDPSRVYANTLAEVDTPARKKSGGGIGYPEGAPRLKSGESVSVSVSFVVTENGEVTDLNVLESGGRALDEAVASTIRTWKYAPAVKKGTKVKVLVTFKQTFRAG